ncbi:sensor histidine kinase [Streptomyces sp. MA5143a]|uniref:sensor histidine kinase n=1 Tax=Streptomyces sp. MA5143a TaxID=2083010 RepID=UPI000D19916F|nr:sensor histidine kinase [Streptomyces sp. MA5143a]SPF04209.1 sensory histidine kinase CreC [Streptomyces sp. MA5143a]
MTAPSPPRPPGDRPALRSVLPLPLVTAVFAAAAAGGSVALAPASLRVPVAGGAGAAALLLTLAVAVAVHARQSARSLRHRLDAVSRDTGMLLQERARLTAEFGQERARLTEEFLQDRARIAADYARERTRLTAELDHERGRLADERAQLETKAEEERSRLLDRARQAETERTAALAVTANVAGRMQALATGTLADLRAMEERHADEDVLADLLHLDHRTAQAGRLADSVAVLAGARSGRRWARPIPMESILRGAMGRIGAYRRVRLHSSSESAVAGHAAEGVMHALAELLDNAANFSPPTAEVHVYVEEVPTGVIISVEDAGLVMSDVQLRRAERAVSGEDSDLTGLTGTRLGLAVVGRLARKHGLKVSFRPSARGGTGVLMLVPQDVLAGTVPAAPAQTPAPTDERSTPYAAVPAPHDLDDEPTPTHESPSPYGAAPGPEEPPTGPGGLPRRRRGRSLAEAEARTRAQSADAPPARDSRPAEDASTGAVRFSSFRRAVRGTSGLDQAFVQGTSTDDEPSTGLHRRTEGAEHGENAGRPEHSESLERPDSTEPPGTPGAPITTGTPFPQPGTPFPRPGTGFLPGPGGESLPEPVRDGLPDAGREGLPASGLVREARSEYAGELLPEPLREPVREPVGEQVAGPVPDAPVPSPGTAVPPLALEPAREPEWGVARGATWETSSAPEPEWEPTAPVTDPGWEPEPVRGARWEFEPVRDDPWQPVGDTPWQPGLARIPLGESEPVRETAWQAEPARTSPQEPEPVRDTAWQAGPTQTPPHEVEPVRDTPWQAEPPPESESVRDIQWQLDALRELARDPQRDDRPAPGDDNTPSAHAPSSHTPAPPVPPYPDPGGTGAGPAPLPHPDPHPHPDLEGDPTP